MRASLICLGFAFFAVGIVCTIGSLNPNGLTVLAGVGVVILWRVRAYDLREARREEVES